MPTDNYPMSYYPARNLRKQFGCWGYLSSNPRAFILIYLPRFFSSFLAPKKRASCLFEKTNFLLCFALCKEQKHGQEQNSKKKREERGEEMREKRNRRRSCWEKKKKKHLGWQFCSCEFVCRAKAGQAVKKLLIFFLTTCMRLFAYVLVPSTPPPLSPFPSILLIQCLMLICCCCPDCRAGPVCVVFTLLLLLIRLIKSFLIHSAYRQT